MKAEPPSRQQAAAPPQVAQTASPPGLRDAGERPSSGGAGGSRTSGTVGRRGLLAAAAVAVMAIAGATYFGMSGGPAEDNVSDQQKQAWAAGFLAARPFHVPRVTAAEIPAALALMQLPPAESQSLKAQIDNNQVKLIWVTLWDTMAEDGDTVQLDSGGYRTVVKLKNAMQKVAVPEPENGIITVTGVYDGGGGITVGMISGDQPVNLPIMDVGQVLAVPIAAGP